MSSGAWFPAAVSLFGVVSSAAVAAVALKDLGDTFSALTDWLILRASRRLPPHLRERLSEEWRNELPYIFPSKFAHIRFALGCYRCAIGEARRYQIEQRHKDNEPSEKFAADLAQQGVKLQALLEKLCIDNVEVVAISKNYSDMLIKKWFDDLLNGTGAESRSEIVADYARQLVSQNRATSGSAIGLIDNWLHDEFPIRENRKK